MKDLIKWIIENKEALIAIGSSLYVIASIIVRLTPSKNDDKALKEITGKISKARNIIVKIFNASKKTK